MKILCIADHIDPLVYSSNIKQRFKDIDLIISAGDLRFRYYDFILTNLNKDLVFVFGNHNLKRLFDYKPKLARSNYYNPTTEVRRLCCGTYIGGRVKKIRGILIAGLGGSMRYNRGLNQYTEVGMFFYMLHIIPALIINRICHGRYLDILVTHAPPFGIHDMPDLCHRGFKIFLWFMKKFKPRYLVHGHIHLYESNSSRRTKYGETTVVNAYNHTIIELN